MNKEYSVLLLPGWQNSDADHWQSRWEQAHGYQRVQQHNWQQPLRGDWTVQLNEAVLAAPTAVVLVAHSLGCILTAWWARHAPPAVVGKVQAALWWHRAMSSKPTCASTCLAGCPLPASACRLRRWWSAAKMTPIAAWRGPSSWPPIGARSGWMPVRPAISIAPASWAIGRRATRYCKI